MGNMDTNNKIKPSDINIDNTENENENNINVKDIKLNNNTDNKDNENIELNIKKNEKKIKKYIKQFNKNMLEFINDITGTFPEYSENINTNYKFLMNNEEHDNIDYIKEYMESVE